MDWYFYQVYGSTHNKETMECLQMRMSLPGFEKHKEFVEMREAMEAEQIKKAEEERRRSQARGR